MTSDQEYAQKAINECDDATSGLREAKRQLANMDDPPDQVDKAEQMLEKALNLAEEASELLAEYVKLDLEEEDDVEDEDEGEDVEGSDSDD